MKHDFMSSIAQILAEVRNRTCIDDVDAEVIEKILQEELNEYYDEVYALGYDDGYDNGYYDGHSEVEHERVQH